MATGGRRRLLDRVAETRWAAWLVSGVGLALAGLSLWYLIVIKALHFGTSVGAGTFGLVLKAIEISLLAGFSLVLVYAGYWLASSRVERKRVWWASMWTMVGLAGIVALVALVTAFELLQGQEISEPTLVQEMLLAAGGGAIAGLLIGVSTIRETVEAERARRQRDTLMFVNELLRHNVLNGMNVILGNNDILREHVDDEGERFLAASDERAETIVDLIENVRALMQSTSGEHALRAVNLSTVVSTETAAARAAYGAATFEDEVPDGVVVRADDLLAAVFENLLANAVEHNDSDRPEVTISAEVDEGADVARVRVADDGVGMSEELQASCFDAGEQDVGSVGQGLGLYLVDTLVERYGGDVWVEDNDPRGSVFVVELPLA